MVSKKRMAEIYDSVNKFGNDETAKKFNLSASSVKRYFNLHKKALLDSGECELSTTISDGELNIVSKSYDVKSLDDLIIWADIDTDKWEISKHIANIWGSKDNPCHQIKAWFKEKTEENKKPIDFANDFKEVIKNFNSPVVPKLKKSRTNSGSLLEISIHDHHFGQLSWNNETNSGNYDVKIAKKIMLDAVKYLIEKAMLFTEIDEILFVTGSDFFNVNSKANTTSHGTLQDEDCRWKKTFKMGLELNLACIEMCSKVAKTTAMVICGNHDEERAFYMGCALESYYRNNENVIVDNSETTRKYFAYGNTLIQVTHGSEEKKKDQSLPMLMTIEEPILFSRAKYRECQSGHLHQEKKTNKVLTHDDFGFTMRIMPSLVAPSQWAYASGYASARKSLGLIHSKKNGIIAEIPFNI